MIKDVFVLFNSRATICQLVALPRGVVFFSPKIDDMVIFGNFGLPVDQFKTSRVESNDAEI